MLWWWEMARIIDWCGGIESSQNIIFTVLRVAIGL
jgi:hypothetical protein